MSSYFSEVPNFEYVSRLPDAKISDYITVKNFFKRSGSIRDLISKIDLNESHCDHIERRIIMNIFDSKIDPFQKLQLKELISRRKEKSED